MMKNLYSYITESLKNVGSGAEGTVYLQDDGRIRKVFKHRLPITYKLLYQASQFYDLKALPKIYEIGDDYIVRDNCKLMTPKCKKYYDIATKTKFGTETKMIHWVNKTGEYDPETERITTNYRGVVSGDAAKVLEWLYILKYELSQIGGEHYGLGDFKLENLGEDSGGNIKLIDF